MLLSLVSFFTLSHLVAGSPIDASAKRAANPSVSIADGTVIGNTLLGVENFKGIPYAQPPVGDLRLRPPQPLKEGFGTFTSQLLPKACPQFWSAVDGGSLPGDVVGLITNAPVFSRITQQSEDCLTLNVQRPAGTTADDKLPVVVWIFGGAFAIGATHLYDGTRFVKESVDLKKPVVYVAINYRLGGFGFLPGKEISADGSSNLGLRDQRLALQWVQDNIAKFGGDPSKVTLWGESAGAISACDHTIINGGDTSYNGGQLFRGAILNSGTVVPTVPVDHPKAQAIYDEVVSAAGCASSYDTLACLRALPLDKLSDAFAANPSFFSYTSINLAYLPRPDPADDFMPVSPEEAVQSGAFAKVPIITGNQQDEGTLFSLTQKNITTTARLIDYLTPVFPLASADVVKGLADVYPDDPTAGSPFNTWYLNNIYPQFKRVAAILGDVGFIMQRRAYLAEISSQVPTWSYIANYLPLTPVLGTFHASDALSTFFNVPPVLTTDSILRYYVAFVNDLDPNTLGGTAWPRYEAGKRELLQYGVTGFSVIKDDFRQSAYEYLERWQNVLRI